MFRQILTWRTLLAVVAILIVSGTILYSSYLAEKIEREERQNVEEWAAATNAILNTETADVALPFRIVQNNDDIPIIETNERDSITSYVNLDSTAVAANPNFLKRALEQFRSENGPIVYYDPLDSTRFNRYYYGHSRLLREVRYYPLVQLFIVGLFIVMTILFLRSNYLSTQNGVWAGMAKETAHQLGTPVSSLEGWVELLKESAGNEMLVQELEKDVNRLRLVSDRFGKIGSTPQLENRNIVDQITNVVEYVRKRASGKVTITVNAHGQTQVPVLLSGPLFDWVIENLLKNALDAMEGRGAIQIDIHDGLKTVTVDVTDTGKGISKQHLGKVFKPGFTTKKRGWGLGLSLSKRIIEQYHKGTISVKSSEVGRGTTFRIVLKK
jgi:signal transduction histidine kinase